MDINTVLKERREEILRMAGRHGAAKVRIFGSVARGEADSESDLDQLADPDHRDELGKRAVDYALDSGNVEIIQLRKR